MGAAARRAVESLDVDHPDRTLPLGFLSHAERAEVVAVRREDVDGAIFEYDPGRKLLGLWMAGGAG